MTWDNMSHEVSEFKELLVNQDGKVIGFVLKGTTYDGDGNIQWEDGTDMEILFNSPNALEAFLERISREIKIASRTANKSSYK